MDLGGTNLRVLLVELCQGKVCNELVKHYPLPNDLRIGCGTRLFDYLAQCVKDFISDNELRTDFIYPLGFTFSFPMHQHSLNSAVLVTWTKSFNCPSIVGEDVVEKLRESLASCGCHNVEVIAILNDTTGTLMHGALLNHQTRIGIVVGTGTNGCYMEYADRVKHWEEKRHEGENYVVIDVEWGAFGDNGVLDFIRTDYDRAVDEGSLLRNSFTFEKYIGGKYLGELCRVILKGLYDAGLFMVHLPQENFPKPWTFNTNIISLIEEDTIHNCFERTHNVLKEHFVSSADYTTDDCYVIRYVCGVISLRAAQLLSINTSMLLNRMNDERDITIAIDGSVYKLHPRIRHWLDDYTKLWTPDKNINYMLAEDGSGKGAALVAAIADKLRKRY
uniref:Phosphotransferase n=3 Tax=Zeugodacus cucurbitae TaxID=28588 RepID=A0A0A1WEY4_ZEUCU